jgi:hypothetical protein
VSAEGQVERPLAKCQVDICAEDQGLPGKWRGVGTGVRVGASVDANAGGGERGAADFKAKRIVREIAGEGRATVVEAVLGKGWSLRQEPSSNEEQWKRFFHDAAPPSSA